MPITLTQEQKIVLSQAVDEAVKSKYREQSEKELRREIAKKIKDEIQIPTKTFNSVVLRKYKNDAEKLNEDVEEVLDLAEELGFYSHQP